MEWHPRRNHPCQILCQSVKRFLGGSAPKMAISYTFWTTLTTVLHYRADCDKQLNILICWAFLRHHTVIHFLKWSDFLVHPLYVNTVWYLDDANLTALSLSRLFWRSSSVCRISCTIRRVAASWLSVIRNNGSRNAAGKAFDIKTVLYFVATYKIASKINTTNWLPLTCIFNNSWTNLQAFCIISQVLGTVVTVVSSQMSVSFSTLWSDCNPPQIFDNGHINHVIHGPLSSGFSDGWFSEPYLCRYATHGPWLMLKQLHRDQDTGLPHSRSVTMAWLTTGADNQSSLHCAVRTYLTILYVKMQAIEDSFMVRVIKIQRPVILLSMK